MSLIFLFSKLTKYTNKLMKNIFLYPNFKGYDRQSEIVETEISDWQSDRHLPRHLSVPETQSHRGRYDLGKNLAKTNYLPRVCRLNSERQNRASLAVDILKYQLGDRVSQQKHLENLRHNLERRLQVAKSQGNSELLNILQDEYEQLKTSV